MVKGYGYSERFAAPKEDNPLPPRPVGEERPPRESGIYIDWGPSLPESYPVDRLTALVRDPYWVWFHWFLEGGRSDELRRIAGREPDWILIVESRESLFEYAVPRRCPFWWVKVEPGRYYRARLAARIDGKEYVVCRTAPFRTPRPWVKARAGVPAFVREFALRQGFHLGPASAPEPGEGRGAAMRPADERGGALGYPYMPTSGERA